jgi:hypothetical protein
MDFVVVAEAVREPHLLDPARTDSIDKPGHTFRNEVRMDGFESQL